MQNLKLKSIAIISAFSFAFTASAATLLEDGKELLDDGYSSTDVPAVEQIRMPINSSFKASLEIYEAYHSKAFANSDYENFYKSVEGKDEAEVKTIFEALSAETQGKILAVDEANSEILASIGQLLVELVAQQAAFQNMDAKSALSSLSMWDMPSALTAVKNTGNELLFISDSVGEIYRISEILDAQRKAV